MRSLHGLYELIGGFAYPLGLLLFLVVIATMSNMTRYARGLRDESAWETKLLGHLVEFAPTVGLLGTCYGIICGLAGLDLEEVATVGRMVRSLGLAVITTFIALGISLLAQGSLMLFDFVPGREAAGK